MRLNGEEVALLGCKTPSKPVAIPPPHCLSSGLFPHALPSGVHPGDLLTSTPKGDHFASCLHLSVQAGELGELRFLLTLFVKSAGFQRRQKGNLDSRLGWSWWKSYLISSSRHTSWHLVSQN